MILVVYAFSLTFFIVLLITGFVTFVSLFREPTFNLLIFAYLILFSISLSSVFVSKFKNFVLLLRLIYFLKHFFKKDIDDCFIEFLLF